MNGAAVVAEWRPGLSLGRYALLQPLVRDAASVGWLARDGQLQRDVLLVALPAEASADAAARWLDGARALAGLVHPAVVPLIEADTLHGRAVRVHGPVAGMPLAQWVRRHGPADATVAVRWMATLADALRAAHERGLVHGQVSSSTVWIDAGQQVHLLGFGVGSDEPTTAGHAGRATAGVTAPEVLRGTAPQAAADVWGLGLLLAELLIGRPLLEARDGPAGSAAQRFERLALPGHADGDERLHHLVMRALADDPALRLPAGALHSALTEWLQPAPEAAAAQPSHATLDFLLRRMRHKSDFPALSDRVLRIQRMANSESEPLQRLADEILQDVALTQKLLRLVNSAHFRRQGHAVGTVSRAVALVGLAGIRNLALSLVLVEHMKDKGQAQRLKRAFLQALLAGQVAQELAGNPREAEEAFLAALFYNLGGLLVEYYFAEEAQTVRQLLAQRQPVPEGARDAMPHPDALLDQVAVQVLGLGYAELGAAVARHWGLPEDLVHCMQRPAAPAGTGPQPSADAAGRLQRLTWAGNDAARLLCAEGAEAGLASDAARPDGPAARHARALGITTAMWRRASDAAWQDLCRMAPAMGLEVPRPARAGATGVAAGGTAAREAVAATAMPEEVTGAAPPNQAAEVLQAGIVDITDTLAGDAVPVNQVLLMVLETIYRALDCRQVVFCLRDTGGSRLIGRFGLGEGAGGASARVQVMLRPTDGAALDHLALACAAGRDEWVPQRSALPAQARLPPWMCGPSAPQAFLAMPLNLKGAPLAMIYADQVRPMPLTERERALLRTLRNQALLAFRQTA